MSGAQNSFWAQRYPEGIIQTLEEREIPLKAFLARGINQGNYDANRGIPGTGLIVSPYFTQTVEEEEVPVYGTLTYAESYDIGTIHSFSTVYVKEEAFPLTVTLHLQGWQAKKVELLPERMQAKAVLETRLLFPSKALEIIRCFSTMMTKIMVIPCWYVPMWMKKMKSVFYSNSMGKIM